RRVVARVVVGLVAVDGGDVRHGAGRGGRKDLDRDGQGRGAGVGQRADGPDAGVFVVGALRGDAGDVVDLGREQVGDDHAGRGVRALVGDGDRVGDGVAHR